MTEEFDTPSTAQEPPSRNDTLLIVLIVILLLLCCFCVLLSGFALWWLWNYGDYLLEISVAAVSNFA
jgi:uncharacterized Tic20 family protein